MKSRAHVVFKGRVQGVFFRANTTEKARQTNVFGWVRNMRDGSVEAIFEGEKAEIEEVIEWCSISQPHAVVEETHVDWSENKNEFDDFSIIHWLYKYPEYNKP